jgi:two-component system cell cycle response regulator
LTARILIVDDTVANLRLLEARLAAEYYEVKSLRDGRGVIAFAADWQPDVILLDVVMPEMNGYDACRLLKASEATSHIPVIMMTANEEIPDRVQALACGADELLTRPAENSILLARLRGTIHLKRVLDEWRMRRATALALGLAPNILDDAPSELGRVLIVDDLVVRALRLRDVLAQAGMTTVLMQHESAAAKAMEDVAPDLIAISLTLMDGDPLRLVAKLRASDTTRNTPLLLIAEANQRSLMIAGLDLGANDCLVLPLDESEFLLRVGNHVRRKLYRDRLRTDVNTALRLAVIDPLTRLYNRRYVIGHLDALYDIRGPR